MKEWKMMGMKVAEKGKTKRKMQKERVNKENEESQ
jgi:hypothetical protein